MVYAYFLAILCMFLCMKELTSVVTEAYSFPYLVDWFVQVFNNSSGESSFIMMEFFLSMLSAYFEAVFADVKCLYNLIFFI